MSSASQGAGVAVFFGYLVHYIFNILALREHKNITVAEVQMRDKKFYLFAVLGLFCMQFATTYGALFCWFCLITLVVHYVSLLESDENKKRKLFNVTGMIYSLFLVFGSIGHASYMFPNAETSAT